MLLFVVLRLEIVLDRPPREIPRISPAAHIVQGREVAGVDAERLLEEVDDE